MSKKNRRNRNKQRNKQIQAISPSSNANTSNPQTTVNKTEVPSLNNC